MLDSQTSVSACLTFGEEGCQISRRRNPSCKSLNDAAWRSCAQLHWPGLLGRPDRGLRLHRPQRALLGARLLWGPWPNPILIILHVLKKLKFDVQGDFLPVSASFLRALASSLEGKECPIVAISTDSIEAHRFLLCSVCHPIFFREFAATSLKGLSIPLVEDKTGEISRSFGVFDPTTHTALPTAFILDDQGELMASFTTSTKVVVEN